MMDVVEACDGKKYRVMSEAAEGLRKYEIQVFAFDDETGEIGETAIYRKGCLFDWEMAMFHRHVCEHLEGYIGGAE